MDAGDIRDAQDIALRRFFAAGILLRDAAVELTSLSLFRDTSPESGLNRLWGVILRIARDSGLYHDKLVDILVYLSKMPPPISAQGGPFVLYDMQVWNDLPMLGWALRDEWNFTPDRIPLDRRHKAACDFANINRLVAHLMATGERVFDYSWFALLTFREALEETSPTSDVLNAYIPAAVAWLEILGADIFGWDNVFASGGRKGAPGRGGPLWEGTHGFCKERWMLWRKRLGEFAVGNENITAEARMAADEACIMMDEIASGEIE